jgi:hypothetical protein
MVLQSCISQAAKRLHEVMDYKPLPATIVHLKRLDEIMNRVRLDPE